MTIYHFQKDAELLRREVLPKKRLFIVDMYNTLSLADSIRGKDFSRHGVADFFRGWDKQAVICSDGDEEKISNELYEYGLRDFFSKIYGKKSLNRKSNARERVFKRYEAIARVNRFKPEEAIIIEDWNPNDHRLARISLDYIIIPSPLSVFSCIGLDKRHLLREALRNEKRENGYTFKLLMPE